MSMKLRSNNKYSIMKRNSGTSLNSMQCVNCGLNLKRIRRRWMADESEELRQLLSDWACKELEGKDMVCCECYSLLYLAHETENKSRRFGHKSVCLPCGRSLTRLRTSPMLDGLPEEKLVIAKWIPSHQVKRLEQVCVSCWLRATRHVKKKNNILSNSTNINIKTSMVKTEPSLLFGDDELDIPASPEPSSEDESIPDKNPQPLSIVMGTYKRAPTSSSRCIFKKCRETDMSTPSRAILERLLIDYSFYLPTRARICKQHQINSHKEWRDLIKDSQITDFTVGQLENLCSILKNTRCNTYCKKFATKLKQDYQLCNYFFGVAYEIYEEMKKDLGPLSKQAYWVQKALAMYLMKKHTGFGYDKIASFFGMRTRASKQIINKVHKCLASIAACDNRYVAKSNIGEDNQEEIIYYRVSKQ